MICWGTVFGIWALLIALAGIVCIFATGSEEATNDATTHQLAYLGLALLLGSAILAGFYSGHVHGAYYKEQIQVEELELAMRKHYHIPRDCHNNCSGD